MMVLIKENSTLCTSVCLLAKPKEALIGSLHNKPALQDKQPVNWAK